MAFEILTTNPLARKELVSMSKVVCDSNKCVGCSACVDICPQKAITLTDHLSHMSAEINEDLCVKCGACYNICQTTKPVPRNESIEWFQGWASVPEIRKRGTSGGVGGELARSFVASGGYVCSCVFEDGDFRFKLTNKLAELPMFAGSKYVKSNPSGIYKQIRRLLYKGEKVLFIGLPCQCAAAKKFANTFKAEGLYTVELVCHGTPSKGTLEHFLSQYDLSLDEMDSIRFRKGGLYQVGIKDKHITRPGAMDPYSIAFFYSMTCTDNCYRCPYADTARVADITIGDPWSSSLQATEGPQGLSLILCNTAKGTELLATSNICLKSVDIEAERKANPQLHQKPTKPEKWDIFFEGLKSGTPFNRMVWECCPKNSFRQTVKSVLVRLHLARK